MEASPKLQKAGRLFLMRLVAENGPEAAAATLRELADELESLQCDMEQVIHVAMLPGQIVRATESDRRGFRRKEDLM